MEFFSPLLAFAAGLFVIWLIFKIFGLTVKVLWKLILNAVIGALMLIAFNLIGGIFDFTITITPISALVAGVFGVPGVVVMIILKLIGIL